MNPRAAKQTNQMVSGTGVWREEFVIARASGPRLGLDHCTSGA